MPTLAEILLAKHACSARLLRVAAQSSIMSRSATLRVASAVADAGRNVHAVGVGRKLVDDKATGEMCVRFYVIQKLARSLLPPRDLLPETIDGIPTDVIESPPAFVQARRQSKPKPKLTAASREGVPSAAATPNCTSKRKERQRPLVAGISVAQRDVTAGTLAYFCRSTRHGDNASAVHILSNNHVLANVNQGSVGDDVLQPDPADGGVHADVCAALHRFVPVALGGNDPNLVDCAIALLADGVEYQLEVCSIGKVAGVDTATEDMIVRKHGRTSGYTEGKVSDIHYDALVGMDHNDPNVVALFQNQIRVEAVAPYPAFGLGGDSGSLVLKKDSALAVGLYFAGPDSGTYGVANQIGDALGKLEIALLT